MFIDTSKCVGCRGCMTACKSWNELPGEKTKFTGTLQNMADTTPNTYTLIKFFEKEENNKVHFDFFKKQCLHCADAACEKACPEKAIEHSKDGAVVRDKDKCIGCDYCQRACPFDVPKIDENKHLMSKCTLCFDRISNGEIPACAKACIPGAITFGDRDNLVSAAQKRLTQVRKNNPNASLYGASQEELGGTGVFYLLTDKPEYYGLPSQAKLSEMFKIWHGFVKPLGRFVPGFTLAVTAVALIANAVVRKDDNGEGHNHEK